MKFSEFIASYDYKNEIETYIELSNIYDDSGVDTKILELIYYVLDNQIFKLYYDFNMLFTKDLTKDILTSYLLDKIPVLYLVLRQRSLVINKVFSKLENLGIMSKSENQNTLNYEGLNTEGVYRKTTNKNKTQTIDLLHYLSNFDVNIKSVFDEMKNKIESLLVLWYNI